MPGFDFRSPEMVDKAIAHWGVKQDEGDDFVRIGGIKPIVDGGFEGGHLSRPQAFYDAVVLEINRKGWRATTHASGDAAVDEVLTAYELANKDKPLVGDRWAIEHASIGFFDAETGTEIDPVTIDRETGAPIGTRPIRIAAVK